VAARQVQRPQTARAARSGKTIDFPVRRPNREDLDIPAFLRNKTVLADDVVLGVFTEVKDVTLADGVRARHHSYLGDAVIGQHVNIGAGSLTANFDGKNINQTTVGDECYIGSGAVLIAPLVIKPGAHIGAGTVVSQESADTLGEER